MLLSGKWSRDNTPQCIKCGTKERPHYALGMCELCYGRTKRPPGDYSCYSKNRRYAVNDFIFDSWDEVSAYLLGAFYADGHVTQPNGRRYGMVFAISESDIDWCRDIASAFDFQGQIQTSDNWAAGKCYRKARFAFSSTRIHAKLIAFGIKDQIPPPVPDVVFCHFVRGFFDGDGTIYLDSQCGNYHSGFIGSKHFLTFLRDRLNRMIGTRLVNLHPSSSVFTITFAKSDTRKLGDFMYRDAAICLKRKQQKFSEVKDQTCRIGQQSQ